jgi:hypothetical protein
LWKGIGHFYSTPDQPCTQAAGKKIHKLLDRINPAKQPACPFEASVSASIRAEELLIFQRFLRTITTLRVQWCLLEGIELSEKERTCSLEDYTLAKTFLGQLPMCGLDSSLSPYALSSAYTLFERIQANGAYSMTIAGESKFGNKAFDRAVAKDVLGICYNTTKKHLQQLEDEGIVETSVLCSKRKRGQHIFFRFKRGRDPPFVSQNPFELLPDPHEIA